MSRAVSRRPVPSAPRPHLKPGRALSAVARAVSLRRHGAAARLRAWLRKTTLIALALASLAVFPAAAQAGDVKEVGVGIVAGDPFGGTAKLWLNSDYAVDLGIGYSGSTALWGDLLYHAWNLLPQPKEGRLGVYFGAGPRIETAADTEFGMRAIAGVSWRLTRQPIEFFAEAGPVFRMTPDGGVDADGGVGVRLYLGAAKK